MNYLKVKKSRVPENLGGRQPDSLSEKSFKCLRDLSSGNLRRLMPEKSVPEESSNGRV